MFKNGFHFFFSTHFGSETSDAGETKAVLIKYLESVEEGTEIAQKVVKSNIGITIDPKHEKKWNKMEFQYSLSKKEIIKPL